MCIRDRAYLDHWEDNWADKRIHGRTKRQVAAMFAEEKPLLQPLPLEPFRYYQYGERTVHLDGCVEVEAAYYGAPPGWIGREVDVQWDAMYVRLLDPHTGELLREHLGGKRGGHRIRDAVSYTHLDVYKRQAVLFGKREHALDAAGSEFALASMDGIADRADARSGLVRTRQQLQ